MSSVNVETVRWPGGTRGLGTDRARGRRGTRVGPRPPRPPLARARAASTGCGPSEPWGASARQTGRTKFCNKAHLLNTRHCSKNIRSFLVFFLSHCIVIVPPTSISRQTFSFIFWLIRWCKCLLAAAPQCRRPGTPERGTRRGGGAPGRGGASCCGDTRSSASAARPATTSPEPRKIQYHLSHAATDYLSSRKYVWWLVTW